MHLSQRFKFLNKFFKNQKDTKKAKYEQILGNNGNVQAFHYLMGTKPDSLQGMIAYLLHSFIEDNEVSSKDVAIYKQALGDVGTFMTNCYIEVEEKKSLKEGKG